MHLGFRLLPLCLLPVVCCANLLIDPNAVELNLEYDPFVDGDFWETDYDAGKRNRRAPGSCPMPLMEITEGKAENIRGTAALLRWTDTPDAQWYTVEVKNPKSSCIRGEGNVTMAQVTLRDLDVDTHFVVSVMSRTNNGCSEPKEITFRTGLGQWKCEGSSDVPGPIHKLTVPRGNITFSGAYVSWDPTPKGLQYMVEITPFNAMYFGLGETEEEWTVLHGLDPGSAYQVTVTAKNKQNVGSSASKKFVTRLDSPDDFLVSNASSSYLRVSWEKPKHSTYVVVSLHEFKPSGDTVKVGSFNTSTSSQYFLDLLPATKYLIQLQAYNILSSSKMLQTALYSKLPITANIRISNVTDHSVFAQWSPVKGALRYRIVLRNYHDDQIVKDYKVVKTSYKLDDLSSASKYKLEVIAQNDETDSLPGMEIVYTRLKQMTALNIDKEYVQDRSLVVRWDPVGGAEWYEIQIKPNTPGVSGVGDIEKRQYTRIENLTPGTSYLITAMAKNHRIFDTASLPATVEQFTRLSKPHNLSASYNDVSHSSMTVRWSPVPHAKIYQLLVYDCSGVDRTTVTKGVEKRPIVTNVLPNKYKKYKNYWLYSYPKVQTLSLQCEQAFDSVADALLQGATNLPSKVKGQGFVTSNFATLTNMRPGVKYEIIVVSGANETRSNPSRILQYTKLTTPAEYAIDPRRIESFSVYLTWNQVLGADYYRLDIFTTPVVEHASKLKRASIQQKYVHTINVTSLFVKAEPLNPSTNCTFKLTACNSDTESFPTSTSTFTLLPRPSAFNAENVTTDTILVQWSPVNQAIYYNVTYTAGNNRGKRQNPNFKNVSAPMIFLNHLLPNTLYSMYITAQNKYTRSVPVKFAKYTELPIPQNFTVAHVTDSFIYLTWSDVEARKTFDIAYVRYPKIPETFRESSTKPEKALGPLAANTPYRIWLRSANLHTKSKVLEKVQYTKLRSPQQFSFKSVVDSDKKLRIRWQLVEDADLYNLVVIPLYNESQPGSTESIPAPLFTDVIQVGKPTARQKRSETSPRETYSRTKRVKRSEESPSANSNAISYIDYRSLRRKKSGSGFVEVEKSRSFANMKHEYHVNVTAGDVILSALESAVNYRVTVRAINENTDSAQVVMHKFTDLETPQSVDTKDVTNDTFLVRWVSVAKATYYQVRIMPETKSWLPSLSMPSGIGNTTKIEMSVRGMQPNTNYTISVMAGNDHVTSKKASVWHITKLSPVENLRIVQSSVKHDRFHLKWSRVLFATKYVILISPPTKDQREKYQVTNGATEVTLTKLNFGTKYHVIVIAENVRTTGVQRDIYQFTKLLPPRNVTIVPASVTSSSFNVRWLRVPTADDYQVIIGNRTNATAWIMRVKQTVAVINGLSSGELYNVTVTAHNLKHKTFSDPVSVQNFTKLKTPENFTISDDDVTATSLIVSWDPVPLAKEYIVIVGVETREDDDYEIFLHIKKKHFRLSSTSVFVGDLRPASYYLVALKAVNKDTESFTVLLNKFTKLPLPQNVTLLTQYYMDTEAELDWRPVEGAEFYELEIYGVRNLSAEVQEEEDVELADDDAEGPTELTAANNLTVLIRQKVNEFHYHTVKGLSPSTPYRAAVQAFNEDTYSFKGILDFVTKSPCSEDYHHFPNTHLSQTLPLRTIFNSTAKQCLQLCCEERSFECVSVSLHRTTSACLLFAEDRNTAPPLAISRTYDHYERKFWQEVSGFQIRSITHNNVAVMNETVELTLTFVYLGKGGCVAWDFGDGGTAYHSILDSNCSRFCENSANVNCTVINADPNNNHNKIKISHDYDMETIFKVVVNVTYLDSYEVSTVNVAINQRGCIFPGITIEEEGKNKNDPKRIFRSHKMLMSATPNIVCNKFPGVQFIWGAVSFADDGITPTSSFPLTALGSEIMVPALTFPLGLYRVSVAITVLDDEQDLTDVDAIYVLVEASPLVAQIKGGSMRTVGAKRIVTWDAASESIDPDIVGDGRKDLTFDWFCQNYTDTKFFLLESGSCFQDMSQLTFSGPGAFSLNTSLMELYVEYQFRVVVRKGNRKSSFKQQVIVKEGDPPDFQIKCGENCKEKMNPTQALALQAVCYNCKARRYPEYKWSLFELISEEKNGTNNSTAGSGKRGPGKVTYVEIFDWETNSTTGSNKTVVVLSRNALVGGRQYVMRINISMDGLDDRVYSFSEFQFITNLPPYGGECTTAASVGNCQDFIPYRSQHLPGIRPKQRLNDTTMEKCAQYCCLTRVFMCLSVSFNRMTSECELFDMNKESAKRELKYQPHVDHFQRLFYRGGAVVDEIVFECRNWKDEGKLKSYPKEGERQPKSTLTYKFTTVPQSNRTERLLLYFGNVLTTPGISMALGDPADDYAVTVIVQVCDMFGECAHSNVIYLQVVPPNSNSMGATLSGVTSGNASKLAILSDTGNSKAAAQLVQSISSIINVDDDEIDAVMSNYSVNFTSTLAFTTTAAPMTTVAAPTTVAYLGNGSRNGTARIDKNDKKQLRGDIVNALSDATSGMTSIDNLQQMTSAMSAITRKTDEVDGSAQKQASNTVNKMAGSLSQFSTESSKEDVTSAASDIVGSLGSVAKSSETNMGDLKSQMMERSEIDYKVLDIRDLSPDEYEYYNKKKLKAEKSRVRRSALGSQDVINNAVNAIANTAKALLNKQMEGEPPADVNSEQLEMKVEKTPPSQLANRDLTTGSGTSLKLPDITSLFGKNATNITEPVDMEVMAFKDNPFGFGEDAAFIDAPVTMLKIGTTDGAQMGSNDTDEEGPGVGVSVPTKFDIDRDMVTVQRSINDTGLSISKFEVTSSKNAILILLEPEDERAEFDVYIQHASKPNEEKFDFKFHLPKSIFDVDHDEERYKIFIPEKDVNKVGVYFIGVRDILNVTQPLEGSKGRVRRRRSLGMKNSTTYHLLIASPGCRRFDQEKKAWTGDGCRVDERSTPEVTQCVCTKLSPTSIFSAEFFVPPNTINFATVWAKIDIADNPAVFSTVICFVLMYIIMLIWASRMDIKDAHKWSLKSTIDNRKEDRCLYQVTVFTGHGRTAATHSKVSCVIFGEKGKSKVRRLMIKEDKVPFGRSSVVHFLLREPKDLGPLTHIHIWHDNTGKGENRSWYLDQIVVQNVRLGNRYFFICDQWLAVDHDDGKVDRTLPVATAENMSAFHRLFISTTTQKFTEDHLWISLFYRPTKSNFTRMQRLSCCMCLLFMTMIANAMFFRSGTSSDKTGTTEIKVGPFAISPLQLWTSFCSTLLVVPVTTLTMTLFKKAKTKEQEKMDKEEKQQIAEAVRKLNRKTKQHTNASSLPNPSDLRGCDAVYTIKPDGTINAQPNVAGEFVRNRVAQWPHWCVYIAWVITWIAVLVSGFFVILYSFEWGREKANQWLGSMMLSFWQSVLIVQPIKVIFLAMFVAAIVKKPDHNALDSVDPQEIREAENKFVDLCADNIESEMQEKELHSLAPPKPPSKRKLRRARKLRKKEKQMSMIIWEVISYTFYIMVLLFLCHGTRDAVGQLINEQLKKTFISSSCGLDKVTTVDYFWRFVDQVVLPNLYSGSWYNGQRKTWRERNFLTDEQSYRVGPARLRQLRITSRSCPIVGTTQTVCRGHFTFEDEERRDYLSGWRKNVTEVSMEEADEDLDLYDPVVLAWKHQNWKELKGVPFFGALTAYPGGGYSAELGVNYESGKLIADTLYRDAWVDHQTRAVFTEFTIYNPNVNLFTCVQLVSEFPPVGAVVTFSSIVSFRLYQYIGAYGTVMVMAQIIFVLHLLRFSYNNARNIIRKGRLYFSDPWGWFDLTIMFMDWTVTGFYAFRVVLTNITISAFHANKRKFVNFQQVMTVDSIVANILALSAFFGIVRFLKLLRFNKKTGMLAAVMKNSAKQWPGFFVIALVFFIAFIHIGYLIFCPYLADFKTLMTTVETMFSTMMGRPIYDDLRNLYKVFGPTFYFIFCFTSSFIILNVLIAIVNESYGLTLEEVNKGKNEHEIIDFMFKRFAKWTGLSIFKYKKDKKVKPAPLSGEDAPLPPLPYTLDTPYDENMINIQKRLDKYVYDLENKYNKYLTVEELRDEVIGEMSNVPDRNRRVQRGVLRRRRQIEGAELNSRSLSVQQSNKNSNAGK